MAWRHAVAPAALLALACAAPRDPATSPTRGWVELRVLDTAVPADPVRADDGSPRPPPCRIELDVDGAPVVKRRLRPAGAGPPYTVEETFRFELGPGLHTATLYYSGCSTHGDQLDSRDTEMPIEVGLGKLTRLEFNGVRLEAYPPQTHSEGVR